jgi:hypothetical protein
MDSSLRVLAPFSHIGNYMILDTESPALTPEEKEIARRLAAKVARARANADKTATELYDPRNLPDLHHRVDRGDL